MRTFGVVFLRLFSVVHGKFPSATIQKYDMEQYQKYDTECSHLQAGPLKEPKIVKSGTNFQQTTTGISKVV